MGAGHGCFMKLVCLRRTLAKVAGRQAAVTGVAKYPQRHSQRSFSALCGLSLKRSRSLP